MQTTLIAVLFAIIAMIAAPASAGPVGERHLVAHNPTAALRDAQHSDAVRVTVWYPAAVGSQEARIDIGPPGKPLFIVGAVAADAQFADAAPHPVILYSHGYGGTARIMAWFGTALARAGYVVVAVDHPGNNGLDQMTIPGSSMFWDRPGDLAAALAAVKADPAIAPHLDLGRLGVAGFSAGGFTSIAATGARVDVRRFRAFCDANPTDGICMPQKEFAVTPAQVDAALAAPALAAEMGHASDDHGIPGVRAAFTMAPAIIQAFTPESLSANHIPIAIILGDADPVAPPATNGLVAAKLLPHAELKVLPGVGHYDFLATCTPAGVAQIPVCADKVPQDSTHQAAIDMALAFFAKTLK